MKFTIFLVPKRNGAAVLRTASILIKKKNAIQPLMGLNRVFWTQSLSELVYERWLLLFAYWANSSSREGPAKHRPVPGIMFFMRAP